ncbi:hypothetical protein OHR68_43165 [Spirillospora sp. NBC_00431]
MAILSRLLVRLGVDESGVDRGVDRAIGDLDRLGDAGERLSGQGRGLGEEFSRGFGDGFSRDANGRLRDSLGRFVAEGGSKGADMGSMFAQGFASTGPPGMVVQIAAALALLPALGAVAALGIVMAFGAAFAVIGLKAAATNKGIQKEMGALKSHVGKTMKRISQPFVQTWEVILRRARRVFDLFAPELEKAFKLIAPALSRFISWFSIGLSKLAPAIQPLGNAFSKLLDAIGPALPGMFQGIADALIEIAAVVGENPDLFADFITGLMKLVPLAFKLVAVLAQVFAWVAKTMGTTNAFVTILGLLFTPLILAIAVFRQLRNSFEQAKPTLESLWQTVSTVFGQIWAKISTVIGLIMAVITGAFTLIWTIVQAALNLMKAIIFGDFEQVKATIFENALAIQIAWYQFWGALKAAVSAAWAFIKGVVLRAWGLIKASFTNSINAVKAAFNAGWNAIKSSASVSASQLLGIIKSIPGRIKSSLGNTGHLLYNAGRNVVQGLIAGIRSMLGSLASIASEMASKVRDVLPFSPAKTGPLSGTGSPDRAGSKIAAMLAGGMRGGTGAVANAAAGMAAAAGITPAGVSSPAGVRAVANHGGAGAVLVIKGDGSPVAAGLLELLRMAVRDSGGDVQVVLGRS